MPISLIMYVYTASQEQNLANTYLVGYHAPGITRTTTAPLGRNVITQPKK